jgi:hypothetical protein
MRVSWRRLYAPPFVAQIVPQVCCTPLILETFAVFGRNLASVDNVFLFALGK